jgi:hypothetical protein
VLRLLRTWFANGVPVIVELEPRTSPST